MYKLWDRHTANPSVTLNSDEHSGRQLGNGKKAIKNKGLGFLGAVIRLVLSRAVFSR